MSDPRCSLDERCDDLMLGDAASAGWRDAAGGHDQACDRARGVVVHTGPDIIEFGEPIRAIRICGPWGVST